MKTKLFILLYILWFALICAGPASATLTLNFANVENANIEFVGDTDTFLFNTGEGGADFSITSGTDISDVTTIGLTGVIAGQFTISGVTGSPPFQTATVSGSGTITITDAATKHLVLGVDWLDIYTLNATGGLNTNAAANLTFISYDGVNADLAAFAHGGNVLATFQFPSNTSLTFLTTNGNDTKTSYSGSMSPIPLPPTALLLGSGLVALLGLRYRSRSKG